MSKHAQLHYYYGAMGSAKTAQALMKAYNFRDTGHNVLMAKPMADIRTKKIWSRIGLEAECIALEDLVAMSPYELDAYDVIIIDEIQFATSEQIDFLAMLVDHHNISVFTYGLMLTFAGKLFDGAKRMLELADDIHECESVCWCGAPAKFSALLDSNGDIVRDGENKEYAMAGEYMPLCRKHYMSGKTGRDSIIAEPDNDKFSCDENKPEDE